MTRTLSKSWSIFANTNYISSMTWRWDFFILLGTVTATDCDMDEGNRKGILSKNIDAYFCNICTSLWSKARWAYKYRLSPIRISNCSFSNRFYNIFRYFTLAEHGPEVTAACKTTKCKHAGKLKQSFMVLHVFKA